MEQNYLQHHGILGMKWGVRRSEAQLARARGGKRKQEEPAHEDYVRAHSKTSVRTMSDRELRETNNRLQAEKQYADLTRKTSKGMKAVKTFIAVAGTATAVVTAVGQYKSLYETGKKAASLAKDRIGYNTAKSMVETIASVK